MLAQQPDFISASIALQATLSIALAQSKQKIAQLESKVAKLELDLQQLLLHRHDNLHTVQYDLMAPVNTPKSVKESASASDVSSDEDHPVNKRCRRVRMGMFDWEHNCISSPESVTDSE